MESSLQHGLSLHLSPQPWCPVWLYLANQVAFILTIPSPPPHTLGTFHVFHNSLTAYSASSRTIISSVPCIPSWPLPISILSAFEDSSLIFSAGVDRMESVTIKYLKLSLSLFCHEFCIEF